MSLVLLGTQLAIVVAGNNREPVEPQLQKATRRLELCTRFEAAYENVAKRELPILGTRR